MNVSPNSPFCIIYSLYEHQHLGFLFESFVVQLDEQRQLTLRHQNISSRNAHEFEKGLDETDFKLIRWMDEIQQESVVKQFAKKRIKPVDFFLKHYDETTGNEALQSQINEYVARRRVKILKNLQKKLVFEMGNDGDPIYKRIYLEKQPVEILFNFFRRPEEGTRYFPSLNHEGKPLEVYKQKAILLSESPAWLLLTNQLYHFKDKLDGKKIKPFFNKRFVHVAPHLEENYYKKFVASIIANYRVQIRGFSLKSIRETPKPILEYSVLKTQKASSGLFNDGEGDNNGQSYFGFRLKFAYGEYEIHALTSLEKSIFLEYDDAENTYQFHRLRREETVEEEWLKRLKSLGLKLNAEKSYPLKSSEAAAWLRENKAQLEEAGLEFRQSEDDSQRFFVGNAKISLQVSDESRDWFDVKALVYFGKYEIAFTDLRQYILSGTREFKLPNGQIAIIPEEWFSKYDELFHFMQNKQGEHHLEKQYFSLLQQLEKNDSQEVQLQTDLKRFADFKKIEDYPLPEGFQGELRPYQRAGYNWMRFLQDYQFGGCLADDMGLGKTVQTLALLQARKQEKPGRASLLILPTSLLYNWEKEAAKFAPYLRLYRFTGTSRTKNKALFDHYDIVLTSYGTARIDAKMLAEYHFDYIILDESQAIKNPASSTAKALRKLQASFRLILTGTPIENSTLDLWSQLSFACPTLLGSEASFKKKFQLPIERQQNVEVKERLHHLIKPFVLRRTKGQVAKDLPEKVEQVIYCEMTEAQEKVYEETKAHYRNTLLKGMTEGELPKMRFSLLQGLMKMRQLANHPRLADPEYSEGAGKLDEVLSLLDTAIQNEHKILIFSSFVKHLQLIKGELEKRKLPFAYLDGTTQNRQAEVERFQQNTNIPVFLISIKAGGVGLNLTAADYVFILDPWWNPAVEAQAIDRAHRIGQESKVMIYKFITQNSVEEKILALQADKKILAEEIISEEEKFTKQLSQKDFEQLLA